tara:strand:+ start:622 stop:1062 length:441 start_codon:yes stop_codon:yes gene_type:complete
MKRSQLFKLQGWLSILLILIATIDYALSADPAEFIKVAIAPFGAISALLFAFFVYNRRRDRLDDDEIYSTRSILAKTGIVLLSGAVVVLLTSLLGELTSTLDRVIFSFSIMIAAVIFIFEKLRDFKSMAIMTGIGEGITILMIFFR